MYCSKWILGTLLTSAGLAAAGASEDAIESVLERTREVLKSPDAMVDDEFAEALRKTPDPSESIEWIRPSDPAKDMIPTESVTPSNAQSRAWADIENETFAAHETRPEGPPHPPAPEDVLYVYISLSMPAATIRSLFLEALELKGSVNTIFVLRGWDVPGPNQLVSRLNDLFPDATHLGELPNVQVNPVLFEQQHIELVPTYSKRDSGGRWGQVLGVTSLEDAVHRIEEQRYDGEVIGPTFGIEEPDILKLIEQRAAAIDWDKEVERVREGLLTQRTTGQALPYASHNDSYLVDLTIRNNQNLAGNRGEVFAYAGEKVNPLEYLTLTRRYVFIDANRPEQVTKALEWRAQHYPVTVITTLPVATAEMRQKVTRALGQPIYEVNDLLVKRFQLRAVPAMAYQEGSMLRVDVVATGTGEATVETASERR